MSQPSKTIYERFRELQARQNMADTSDDELADGIKEYAGMLSFLMFEAAKRKWRIDVDVRHESHRANTDYPPGHTLTGNVTDHFNIQESPVVYVSIWKPL